MKKLLYYAFAMMTTLFTMTSCDTDQQIANYLINGNWKGSLDTYYTNRWGDEFLDGEFYTVWRFDGGVYDSYGYVTSGIGYEVDYNIYDEREYAYSSFRWEVNNGNIYIHFREDDTSVVIADYHLSDSRFSGYIADGDNDVYFNLVHTSSPNWDNYRHWGYDDWCDDYYYSRQTRGDGNDSAIATPAKPVRQFGKKAE